MKKWIFALAMIFGMAAQAQDMGVVLGMRADSADLEDSSTGKLDGKTSVQGGLVAKFQIKDAWQVRTGFIYTQRAYTLKPTLGADTDLKFTYFEIPAGLLYKFSDYGGAFIGPAIAMNVSKDCGSGSCSGVNSAPIFMQVGASFKFAPQVGAEVYYETGFSKLADGVKNPKAVIANLMITFD